MKDDAPHLLLIEQLSREYDQKYRNLEKLIKESAPEDIPAQLMALAENAAERFRSAQAAIFSLPGIFEDDTGPKVLPPVTALFRAFDEMRILCHFLFENYRQPTGTE